MSVNQNIINNLNQIKSKIGKSSKGNFFLKKIKLTKSSSQYEIDNFYIEYLPDKKYGLLGNLPETVFYTAYDDFYGNSNTKYPNNVKEALATINAGSENTFTSDSSYFNINFIYNNNLYFFFGGTALDKNEQSLGYASVIVLRAPLVS